MIANRVFEDGVSRLKQVLDSARTGKENIAHILDARGAVIPRYQAVFASDKIESLTADEFRHFLMFRNNRHWASLQRMGPAICEDMDRLKKALRILLDENRPIAERLNELVPVRGAALVPRFGKAVITPILLIAYPEKYGVWNQTSEGGMKTLGLWPEMERKLPFGRRYEMVNGVLLLAAKELGVDLWTLDALWWRIRPDLSGPVVAVAEETEAQPETLNEELPRFGLERHLQEFLRDNWTKTSIGKEWVLYEEDGDPEAGFEYPCDVGRIDLLAKHRTEPKWLVIELKRRTSDQTVGQALRYIGWVKENLALPGESVEGLIIGHDIDESTRYAVAAAPTIGLHRYEVEFRLVAAPPVQGRRKTGA